MTSVTHYAMVTASMDEGTDIRRAYTCDAEFLGFALEAKVIANMELGWQPYGAPFALGGSGLCQAMVKYAEGSEG